MIVGPQGIKGQFRVKPFTANPRSIAAYGRVTTENGQQLILKIMSVNAKGLAIVRADGVDTRDAAESLRDVTLYVTRDSLPKPDDGEYYHVDLLGMMVKGQDNAHLGNLVAIHDFGAGEIAEIATGNGPTIMVPFGVDHIIKVDAAAKEICLTVPRGLLNEVKVRDEAGDNKTG